MNITERTFCSTLCCPHLCQHRVLPPEVAVCHSIRYRGVAAAGDIGLTHHSSQRAVHSLNTGPQEAGPSLRTERRDVNLQKALKRRSKVIISPGPQRTSVNPSLKAPPPLMVSMSFCLTLFSSSRCRYQRRAFSRTSRPEHRASFSLSRSFRRLICEETDSAGLGLCHRGRQSFSQ